MATAFSKATLRGIEPRYKEKFDADLQNFIRKTGGNVSTGLTRRREEWGGARNPDLLSR